MSVPDPDGARRWLRFAHEDLTTAARLGGSMDAVPRHVCWLAQQAAEKALKAALIAAGIQPPRVHDLDKLWERLPREWNLKATLPELAELSEWAIESRYPGDWPEPSWEDAQRAIADARTVCDMVVSELTGRGIARQD